MKTYTIKKQWILIRNIKDVLFEIDTKLAHFHIENHKPSYRIVFYIKGKTDSTAEAKYWYSGFYHGSILNIVKRLCSK